MADSQSHSVKCLNTSSGRKRFVFKNFSQRVEEIEIDVFRSLEPVKPDPSSGSSFFRDSLLHWRELNTAEDFISFYEKMIPLVQTLPQILLHREKITAELLRRLHMGARLSLEPLLMLIAALSRDILEEFLPFLQRFTDSLVDLLKNGGDRDPEILEQVFTSWSYIMMYLQKYITKDVVNVLKITTHLRYFPKDYVQEFMAESVSFLMRNSPFNQLTKGIRKIIIEVSKSSSLVRKTGVVALLWHVMRGTSSKLHSRAEKVLCLLLDKSTFSKGDKFDQGPEAVLEVTSGVIHRLCKEVDHKELNVVYKCLFEKISSCISDGCFVHLDRVLYLLTYTVSHGSGSKAFDTQAMLELVRLLIQAFIVPADSMKSKDHSFEVQNRIMQLMLCLLDVPLISGDLPSILMLYAPAFKLKNSSLLMFIKGLLKDPHISNVFRSHIISAMDDLIEGSPEEIISLMLTFIEGQGKQQSCDILHEVSEDSVLKICNFFKETLSYWSKLTRDAAANQEASDMQVSESELAVLWGTLSCYPQFQHQQDNLSLVMDLIGNLDKLLVTEADSIAGLPKSTWQSLVGAALATYNKLLLAGKAPSSEASIFLRLAKRHKTSPQVLFAVAEFLDSVLGSKVEADATQSIFQENCAEEVGDLISTFSDNLALPNKAIRVSTLRILSHYAPPDRELCTSGERPHKKLKTESGSSDEDYQFINVIELLLSIESTHLSVSTSRKVIIFISRLQMGLSSARICEDHVPLLLNGIIGILHNRFAHLWEPTLECLTALLRKYKELTWTKFVQYLGNYQLKFLSSDQSVDIYSESHLPTTLSGCFSSFLLLDSDSTPCMTVTALLLQALQKIHDIAESRSRQLIPLFLQFLGYADDDILSVESFSCHNCKGKEWRSILKEWLNLLRLMRNSRSLYRSQILKEVLINRLLDEIDPDIQLAVLDCLLNWREDFLTPYYQNLQNLIVSKSLREELTRWAVSKESHYIQEGHRESLIPIVIRLLTPKIRKLKALTSRKHTGGNHRKAVLCFLAQLDTDELQLFFSLLLRPLFPNPRGNGVPDILSDSACKEFTDKSQSCIFMKCSTLTCIADLSWKKKFGFLYVLEEIFGTFDELHIKPFLNPLMMVVVRLLESCMSNLNNEDNKILCTMGDKSTGELEVDKAVAVMPNSSMPGLASQMSTSTKQFKDLRSLCLKIISFALNKYESHDFGSDFWDIFFSSVKPLIDSFKQEGSSSERPSSLFSCFVTMSRSPTLVSLLVREANLVPSIFSILTVRSASDAIISSVLNFIENLLNLDNEACNSIKSVLLPHLETLICSFHVLFKSRKEVHRKTAIFPGKAELRIFKLISKYINNPWTAGQFIDILLPFFSRKSLDSDECLEGLHVMKGILPAMSDETTGKVLNAMNPLLFSVGLDLRLCICEILDGLALKDPSLSSLAKLLHELNAVSSSDIGELDYDTRVTAYDTIRPELFRVLKVDHALVVLSQCVYDMSSEELIFRQSASRSLLSFIQFASSILNGGTKDLVTKTTNTTSIWTKDCIQQIIQRTFLQNMGKAMCKDISIQKEWIALLRDMVYNLREVPALNSFHPLCSEDAEVDFFNNILHLQIHRRGRALARFRNVISAGNLAEDITLKIFVPLFFCMLFDVKAGKGEHLRDACMESLASIAGHMQWKSYHAFLMRCFREMTIKPDKQKTLVRLICAVLDKFHFYSSNSCQAVKDGGSEKNFRTALSSACSVSNVPSEVQVYLQKVVLPQIQKLLTSDSEKVNVNISIAALKLLKLLPTDALESQLPTVIHRICNFLKHRLESIRDEARSALAACAKELGLEYLHFIVKVLRGTLKRGYELHVLGYTLNFILSKTLVHPVVGKLDYCLEDLLTVAVNDILGDVAEEKEVDKIASKMKETRKSKSFETLKLISESVTFRTHALKLLSPIDEHLQKHLTPKIKAKLEMMLHHIASGIEANPSTELSELFIFVYSLIVDSITEKESIIRTNNEAIHEGTNKTNHLVCRADRQLQNAHLITVFALGVLQNRLKNMKLDKNDEQLLSMLDPFVKLLGDCLSSKYEDILSAAFRCLAPLIRLPLPSLEAQADKIKNSLLEIAQQSGNATSPLVQSCLKLLTVLLQSTRISLSNDQLHLLIQFPLFIDLQTNPSPVALSLLKSIIGRKLVVHEIYDVVMRVAELMVTSQSEPVRRKCSQILLQFLLDYQLSDKRLQQHMDFLLANLSYEHSSGREAVLEMLHSILLKFPKSVVDNLAQTFFLHLVVALANDRDHKVRSMVATVIKVLVGRSSQHALHPILEYSLSWYMGEKQNLWCAAAQVLGLLAEELKKGFHKHIKNILQVAKTVLMLSTDAATSKDLDFSSEPAIPFWKEAYYSLVMLEKMLINFPELYLNRNLEDIWEMIDGFLLHPHIWLRDISSRLVVLYFASVSEASRADDEKLDLGTSRLLNPRRLFVIAVSFVNQLRTPPSDVGASNIIIQNLVFSLCGLHSFAKQRKDSSIHEFWSNLDLRVQGSYIEAFDLLGSRKAKNIFLLSTNDTSAGDRDQTDRDSHEDLQSVIVAPLFKKMGKIAMQMEDIQMNIVFNCFKMISSQIDPEGCHDYAIHILHPLYKVCEGFAGKVVSDEIKQLAAEVRDSIRDVLGADNFVRYYNQIRKDLKEKRDKRRQEQKLIAVVNPMQHAKRKLRVAAKNRSHKKRKITAMRMGRWRR